MSRYWELQKWDIWNTWRSSSTNYSPNQWRPSNRLGELKTNLPFVLKHGNKTLNHAFFSSLSLFFPFLVLSFASKLAFDRKIIIYINMMILDYTNTDIMLPLIFLIHHITVKSRSKSISGMHIHAILSNLSKVTSSKITIWPFKF